MLMMLLLLGAVAFLAYANGANDNFKGVATLYGCGVTGFRTALVFGTAATLAGSLCSLVLAEGLVRHFSGEGLVPDAVALSPEFLLAVALGAALTVFAAALAGIPISTTHALTGALLGGGLAAIGAGVAFSHLGKLFVLPLAVSPVLALALTSSGVGLFRRFGGGLLAEDPCLCRTESAPASFSVSGAALVAREAGPSVVAAPAADCDRAFPGESRGIRARSLLETGHFLSAGLVSFARGLNDTPKLVALLIASTLLGLKANLVVLALAMACGGLLHARKVATTMGRRITPMPAGPAFAANLVTAALVIGASRLGVPVSTTHVSVGAISGIGLVSGKADRRVLAGIVLSWVLTLPMGAGLAYACHAAFSL